MAVLHLHNTLTRRKEPFEPLDASRVRLYVCGPTVYQRIHVGNARPLVVFDVLFRLLRHTYGADSVVYVRNITDIDDKIIDQAAKDGQPIEVLTQRTTEAFLGDAAALGCLEPTHQPRATQHIEGMLALIDALVKNGHAYAAEGHVMFSVPSDPAYGRLSGRNRDEQIAGARVDVAPYKRDPADFVLWKPSPPDIPGWDSPWGRGRPGWHIECSAMAEHYLGVPFDLHGGGIDLIFPHHENEIAQTCCAHGLQDMARVWLHNGFVTMSAEKMSKSLGNILRVDEALAQVPGEAVRFWLLGTHYRQPVDFGEESLAQAKAALDRFYGALGRADDGGPADPHEDLVAALEDDLNTPKAMAVLHDLLREVNTAKDSARVGAARRLRASAALMGLLGADPAAWLRGGDADAARIEGLIADRLEARRTKDFARADAIRAELLSEGIVLEDGPRGTTWRRA